MPVNSAHDLVELAKRKPNSITIGITGRGAISDLGRQLFEDAAGIKLQGVPYRGAAPALTDMLAGHLDGLFGDVPTIMAQVKAGKLKALAATSSERSDIFPDVPTFVEQGFAGVVGDNWDAVLAPAGTPQPIIAKLNAALVAAVNDPEVRTRLHNSGTTPAPSTPGGVREISARGDRALGQGDPRKRHQGRMTWRAAGVRIGTAERDSTFLSQGYALKTVLERNPALAPVEVSTSGHASVENANRLASERHRLRLHGVELDRPRQERRGAVCAKNRPAHGGADECRAAVLHRPRRFRSAHA